MARGKSQVPPQLAVSTSKSRGREADTVVRAAGGVVRRRVRRGLRRRDEIVVVHRPRYDDWTLPKGKRDGDESDEQTALREVREETGLCCTLGPAAGETRYVDGKGRNKVVRYWMMDADRDAATSPFVPNREVDELRWLAADDACRLLTYEHDRELLRGLGFAHGGRGKERAG